MKKSMAFCCGVLTMAGLTPVSAPAAERVRTVDGFEYATVDQLRTVWTITGTGFVGPVEVRLNTTEMKAGRQCLELVLPPTQPEGLARVTLDVSPNISLKAVKQFRFWLFLQRPAGVATSGLYCGDQDWKNSFNCWGFQRPLEGWQRVYVSQSGLTLPEGNPSWDELNQMRISLWFGANQPGNRMLLDEIELDSTEERPMNLNGNWYD